MANPYEKIVEDKPFAFRPGPLAKDWLKALPTWVNQSGVLRDAFGEFCATHPDPTSWMFSKKKLQDIPKAKTCSFKPFPENRTWANQLPRGTKMGIFLREVFEEFCADNPDPITWIAKKQPPGLIEDQGHSTRAS